MAGLTPETSFTRDILGRYVCNSFAEAMSSGPFDVIIVGGGTNGLALAQDLFFRTRPTPNLVSYQTCRILVLEAGPFALPEHTQDIPNLQLYAPPTVSDNPPAPTQSTPLPATRQQLNNIGLGGPQPFMENWGLPWNSSVAFGGLAYCLGGRSLYWGGWSPQYLSTEMHTAPIGSISAETMWPEAAVLDLDQRFFAEAARTTGVTTSHDFVNGALQAFYGGKLSNVYGTLPNTVPLSELPSYLPGPEAFPSFLVDAPLAVEIRTRPGFFPFNKFSSVPLATTGARAAYAESPNDNTKKRLMIVPNCHVKSLRTRTYTLASGATVQEVDGIDTGDGFIDLTGPIEGNVNRRPTVVLAMGAIESARMALLLAQSSGGLPNANLIGSNLMVHLRKNLQFTVAPLPAGLALSDQEVAALLVRCRANLADGTPVHFHLQITASALPPGSGAGRSDAMLFQSVPDLDNLQRFLNANPGEVDVSVRAVGEMLPNQPNNNVTLDLNPFENDEHGVRRAWVNIGRSAAEQQVLGLMDAAIDAVAQQVFGVQTNAASRAPDGLGTTFHESGTLRMGDDPARSVTNADGQFHYVTNLYAGDASALPTCGSANPVMNGIALRRRLARRLAPEGDGTQGPAPKNFTPQIQMPVAPPVPGTLIKLFDGATLANWRMAGRGTFHLSDGALQSVPSFALGLLWCTIPMPQNYRLELEFLMRSPQTNSGVFVRFTNPQEGGYYQPPWRAVQSGFEVQIDNAGAPDGAAKHRTGAVYAVNYPGDPNPGPNQPVATAGDSVAPRDALVGAWNQYRIDVNANTITVRLNAQQTARYTIANAGYNPIPDRGQFFANRPTFVGLQSYSNYSYTTAFRNIRITVL